MLGNVCKVKFLKKVIEACALKPDLEMLPGGDQVKNKQNNDFFIFSLEQVLLFGFPRPRSARRASTCPAGRSRGSAWQGENALQNEFPTY